MLEKVCFRVENAQKTVVLGGRIPPHVFEKQGYNLGYDEDTVF